MASRRILAGLGTRKIDVKADTWFHLQKTKTADYNLAVAVVAVAVAVVAAAVAVGGRTNSKEDWRQDYMLVIGKPSGT